MTPRSRLIGSLAAVAAAGLLGVFAAWPIYESWRLALVALTGSTLGYGIAYFGAKRWSGLVTSIVLFVVFVATVVPVAVPQSLENFPSGLGHGLAEGVAGIALGWKQLLTLTLPVGSYQAVLVPAYLVFLLTACMVATVVWRTERFAAFAAVPMLFPVAFGTVFGSSALSGALGSGAAQIIAPRELTLWLGAGALGAVWVWFVSGAKRRAALRLGRVPGERRRGGGRTIRALIGAATVLAAVVTGVLVAPSIDAGARQLPRDHIEPEIVLRERTSPLASYRVWKQDSTLDVPLFVVSSDGALPQRLRLAVLDSYDGVDFHIGGDALGRFTRFPSAGNVTNPTPVSVLIDVGYNDVWVPSAPLGSVPVFSGPRASDLSDALYVNRNTDAAIAVPGGLGTSGLQPGDGFSAHMQASEPPPLTGRPASMSPGFDLETMPELTTWLEAQDQTDDAAGLLELVDRLRARGYLSHSIGGVEGEQLWLARLSSQYGTRFEPSPGGHSRARIEQLFAQLNDQERLAGDEMLPEMLVAAIGDDEQFATAAALIARALGFESRVVVGVRLGDVENGVPGVPSCVEECRGEHLAAWIEVRGAQGVWVPIDVTPQLTMAPTTLEEGERLPEFATTPEERDAREVDPPLGLDERSESAEVSAQEQGDSGGLSVLRSVGLVVTAVILVAIPILFLPVAKRRRERVRRAEPDPELSALGAWQQMVDSAQDAGVEIAPDASRREIAKTLGTAPARWAAGIAAKAVFSPQGVTQEEVEWMWAAVDADRAERLGGASLLRRLRAHYGLESYGVHLVKVRKRQAESATVQREGAMMERTTNGRK